MANLKVINYGTLPINGGQTLTVGALNAAITGNNFATASVVSPDPSAVLTLASQGINRNINGTGNAAVVLTVKNNGSSTVQFSGKVLVDDVTNAVDLAGEQAEGQLIELKS